MHQLALTDADIARRLGLTEARLRDLLDKGIDMPLSVVTAILWELGVPLFAPFENLGEATWLGPDTGA